MDEKATALKTELDKEDSTQSSIVAKQSDNKSLKITYKGYETTINTETGSMIALAKVNSNSNDNIDNSDELDWDELKRTATKHPDQKKSNDIGIDANGNIINLDLWSYESHLENSKTELFLGTGYLDWDTDDICYAPFRSDWESSDSYIENVEMENLVLPKCIKFEGRNDFTDIICLAPYAFYDCDTLHSVVIPDTLKRLSEECFTECSSLTSIDLPLSVDSIYGFAFKNCTALSSFRMYSVVTTGGGSGVFDGCSNLNTITICGDFGTSSPIYFGDGNVRNVKIESIEFVQDVYSGNVDLSVFGYDLENIYIKSDFYDSSISTFTSLDIGGYDNGSFTFDSLEDGYAKYVGTVEFIG